MSADRQRADDTSQEPRAFAFGSFELDLTTGELRRAGLRRQLQPQPFRILAELLRHPGQLVTREHLMSILWPDGVFVEAEHGLNVAIAKIRLALGDLAETPRYVETLERRGYRFMAPVETLDGTHPTPVTGTAHGGFIRILHDGQSIGLGEGTHAVGRDPSCSVWIDSPYVSRHHAVLHVRHSTVTIEDLHSRNGTFVNGARIEGIYLLADGDRVDVDSVQLVIRTTSTHDTAATHGDD